MSVLFTRLVTNEAEYASEDIGQESFECDSTYFVTDHYFNTYEYFSGLIKECARQGFIAAEACSVEIAMESISDTVDAIVEWFKEWIRKFKDFINSCIKKFLSIFVSGEKLVAKMEREMSVFEPFEIDGYDYTIPDMGPTYQILNDFMHTVNSYITEIAYASSKTLNANVAVWLNSISGEGFLAEVRGRMVGTQPIPSNQFKTELKASFRNMQKVEHRITVNTEAVAAMIFKYKKFKDMIEQCKKERDEMVKNVDFLVAWMESEPMMIQNVISNEDGMLNQKEQRMLKEAKILAAHKLYNMANLSAKQLHYLYNIYYTVKLDALHEALQFYLKVITKAYKGKKVMK